MHQRAPGRSEQQATNTKPVADTVSNKQKLLGRPPQTRAGLRVPRGIGCPLHLKSLETERGLAMPACISDPVCVSDYYPDGMAARDVAGRYR